MTGQAHWLTFAILMLAALPVVFLWAWDRRANRRYLVEQRKVRCRVRGNQLVDCTLVRDAKTRTPIGVQSCTLQADGVGCEKECLKIFAHAAA